MAAEVIFLAEQTDFFLQPAAVSEKRQESVTSIWRVSKVGGMPRPARPFRQTVMASGILA
jgi:hypothetical protein